jgi:hypothetical protein
MVELWSDFPGLHIVHEFQLKEGRSKKKLNFKMKTSHMLWKPTYVCYLLVADSRSLAEPSDGPAGGDA